MEFDLQQLIGELQALAQAYPETSKVRIQTVDFRMDLGAVVAESTPQGIEILLVVRI